MTRGHWSIRDVMSVLVVIIALFVASLDAAYGTPRVSHEPTVSVGMCHDRAGPSISVVDLFYERCFNAHRLSIGAGATTQPFRYSGEQKHTDYTVQPDWEPDDQFKRAPNIVRRQ